MPSRRELQRRFGVSADTLRYLERSGYVKRIRRSAQYEFRELLLLRTVGALRAARLPTRTIHRALEDLRPWLSLDRPMNRIALQAAADAVVVREGSALWAPDSGQYTLPLEVDVPRPQILLMKKSSLKPINTAHDHYLRGADLEESDADAAKAAYEACLEGDCSHMNARINLGRLLHLEGRHREAASVYRATEEPDAVLFFNLGVVLEDLDDADEAISAYRDAIVHDPGMADAHFNLALLLERTGQTQAAFRHLLAYRRLQQIQTAAQS